MFMENTHDLTEVREYIRNSSSTSSIYIGCDSKKFGRRKQRFVAYVCVVLIHLDSNHGAKMFAFQNVEVDYGGKTSIKQRMLQEAMMACQIGYELLDVVGERIFEVHLDINPDPKHKSSVAVKEATGYVLGTFGIQPKIKPEAFAASTAADRLVVNFSGKRNVKKFLDNLKKSAKIQT